MRLLISLGVLLSLLVATPCWTQQRPVEPLHRLSADHLELFTTNSESDARELLHAVQYAQAFFRQMGFKTGDCQEPIRIFAFQTEAEYATFRLSSGAFAHYIHGQRGDFIVLQDIRPQHRIAAVHEFTHVVLQRAGLKLPIWLNEGMADVYSSLKVEGNQVTVGSPLPARIKALERHHWIALNTLLTLFDERSLYERGADIGIFYGQSWAFTHMLMFDPQYSPRFNEFLTMVGAGGRSDEALGSVYGKDLATIQGDLQRYWHAKQLLPMQFNVHLESPLPAAASTISSFQSSLELANLLAAAPSTSNRAGELLLSLLHESPNDPVVQEQLAGLTRRPGVMPGVAAQ